MGFNGSAHAHSSLGEEFLQDQSQRVVLTFLWLSHGAFPRAKCWYTVWQNAVAHVLAVEFTCICDRSVKGSAHAHSS